MNKDILQAIDVIISILDEDQQEKYIETTNRFINELQVGPVDFKTMLFAKKYLFSSQKFSPMWERETRHLEGLVKYGSGFAKFDDMNPNNFDETYEQKYAHDNNGNFHYPQIIRLNNLPTYYRLYHFYDNDIRIFIIPGKELHNSVIRYSATPAHANNKNELTILIKKDSPEMLFLEKYRRQDLELKYKNAKFNLAEKVNFENDICYTRVIEQACSLFENKKTIPLKGAIGVLSGKFAPLLSEKEIKIYIDRAVNAGLFSVQVQKNKKWLNFS
jgi:hypothetical protein